jgi:hypothetical protein
VDYNYFGSGDRWPDDVRLSDIEPLFTCRACGLKGADVRPNFDWAKTETVGQPALRSGIDIDREIGEVCVGD